jgi:hypothetical protein
MSAVTDFEPIFEIPERARRTSSGATSTTSSTSALTRAQQCWADTEREAGLAEVPSAPVVRLHRPNDRSVAAPIRLTRRGVIVLSLAVAVLGMALLGIAKMSAPPAANPAAGAAVPANVSVQPGDTLWSIAARVAPQTDPRAEVVKLVQLNRLASATLVPGQLVRVR